jgi:branched-chain amino acid transport system permease protein
LAQAIVAGIVTGSIYGLFALGVVLVYRGTGALNFAQGEIGTVALFAAWWIATEHQWPWLIAAVAAIAFAVIVGLAFERLIVRPMVSADRITVTIATVGFLSFLVAGEFQLLSATPRQLRGPIGGLGVEIFDAFVSPTQMIGIGVTIVLAGGLALFLRRTDFGLGVLAASQDPVTVRLVGVRTSRVSTFVWGTGAALGAIAALFIEPTIGVFTPGFGSSNLFLRGIAAAVVGGLTSLPGALVGGLVVGLLEQVSGYLFIDSALPGIRTLSVFLLVLATLLVRPQGILGRQQGRVA